MQSSLVHLVQEIKISVTFYPGEIILNILEELLTAVLDGRSQLKKLEVTGDLKMSVNFDISSLDPVLLSQALVRLEEFTFHCNYNCRPLSRAQLVSVFTEIKQTTSLELKSLNFPIQLYSELPTEVLTAALVKLEDTNILHRHLSTSLTPGLFTKMAGSSVFNIKTLNPLHMDCTNVPSEIFVDVLLRIESVVIHNPGFKISHHQLLSLFSKIAQADPMRLRELKLFSVNINRFSPDIISRAILSLETFQVGRCDLSAEHVTSIFTQLSSMKEQKLRSLNISWTSPISLPTETLVAGISGLEDLDLRRTRLTTEQLTGIFRMVAERKCSRLREIKLGVNDLSSIPPNLRDRAKINQSVVIG